MQLLAPKWVQFLYWIIIPPDTFGVILKHPRSMLHLGFFAVLARGLKKVNTLVTSVSLPTAAGVLALTAGMQVFLAVEAAETLSNTTTSSLSMPRGEGSVIGDWNGGKVGWVKSALVVIEFIAGLVTLIVMSGMMFGWWGCSKKLRARIYYLWSCIMMSGTCSDTLRAGSSSKCLAFAWRKQSFKCWAFEWRKQSWCPNKDCPLYSNAQCFPFVPAS